MHPLFHVKVTCPMSRSFMLLLVLACCTACVQEKEVLREYDEIDEASLLEEVLGEGMVPLPDILDLSTEFTALLDSRIASKWSSRHKLDELRKLLYGKDNLNIQYDASNTLAATETLKVKSGNCLSLTGLFIASARHVGLDAHYRTVAVDPMWNHDGNTMIRYEHIIATGTLAAGETYVMDFLPEFVVEDMRTMLITDEEALSLYFNNLGAEAIVEQRIDDAIDNLRSAIKLQPDFPDAWNNMGAAMRRAGNYQLAEFSYLRALSQQESNYSALGNLSQLYTYMGRTEEAATYSRRVDKYRSQNPYFLYFQAQEAVENNQYTEARQYLKKSIRLKRDEPDFYVAMAKIYDLTGDEEESARMLITAQKYRDGTLTAPQRRMSHRFWTTMTLNVNSL
jgi:Flp pilus assembly protein TadD